MDERVFKKAVTGIKMPEEMISRILANCEKEPDRPKRKRRMYGRMIAAACVCLLVGAALFGAWEIQHGEFGESGAASRYESEVSVEGVGIVQYIESTADWASYDTIEELIDASDLIFAGTVTNISYQILDERTGLPPTEATEERHRKLYTIFDVDVRATYLGDERETVKVRMQGGQRGVRVEEQIAALGVDCEQEIPVIACGGVPDLQIGESYLFLLACYGEAMPTFIQPAQGYLELNDLKKAKAHAGVSPKDLVVHFGRKKWKELQKMGVVS